MPPVQSKELAPILDPEEVKTRALGVVVEPSARAKAKRQLKEWGCEATEHYVRIYLAASSVNKENGGARLTADTFKSATEEVVSESKHEASVFIVSKAKKPELDQARAVLKLVSGVSRGSRGRPWKRLGGPGGSKWIGWPPLSMLGSLGHLALLAFPRTPWKSLKLV